MVALKSSDIAAFLKRPDQRYPIILIYGPDTGLVSERIKCLLETLKIDRHDPFSYVDLPGDSLAADPERLAEEAHTVNMLTGVRTLYIRLGSKNILPALAPVLDHPPVNCTILIEGGDLKKSHPLRTALEKSARSATLPCYADTAKDISQLIGEELGKAGISADSATLQMLTGVLGTDRLTSRSEIQKLITYKGDEKTISINDIETIINDTASITLEALIDTASSGNIAKTTELFNKIEKDGVSISTILTLIMKHFEKLHIVRCQPQGQDMSAGLSSWYPQPNFRRRPLIEKQLALWSPEKLEKAMSMISQAIKESRKTTSLASDIAERCLLNIATAAKRQTF